MGSWAGVYATGNLEIIRIDFIEAVPQRQKKTGSVKLEHVAVWFQRVLWQSRQKLW